MPRPSLTLALLCGAALTAAVVLWIPGVRVVDGDTVDHGWWRWRLAGLDAPEISKAKCPAERALGHRAAERLRGLVAGAGSGWSLTPSPGPRDPWGRRIGRLTVDGRDVAALLVTEGLARSYDGGKREGWCP